MTDEYESKNIGICPDCGSEVRFKKMPYLGQVVTCRRCDSSLEVVNRSPIELDIAAAEWDDDVMYEDEYRSDRRRNGR